MIIGNIILTKLHNNISSDFSINRELAHNDSLCITGLYACVTVYDDILSFHARSTPDLTLKILPPKAYQSVSSPIRP